MFNVARRYFTRRISRTPIPGNRVKHSPKTSAHDDRCDNRWRENSHRKRDRSVPYRGTDPLQCHRLEADAAHSFTNNVVSFMCIHKDASGRVISRREVEKRVLLSCIGWLCLIGVS